MPGYNLYLFLGHLRKKIDIGAFLGKMWLFSSSFAILVRKIFTF